MTETNDHQPSADLPKTIDWEAFRAKLERAAREFDGGDEPPPEIKSRILRERARLLAHTARQSLRDDPSVDVVEFVLGQERYGIESRFIKEVQTLKEVVPIPCTPQFVLGVINIRGQILSVVDLRMFFGIPLQDITGQAKVLVLANGSFEVGILGDDILGVQTVYSADLHASLPDLPGIPERFLEGVTPSRLIVLNARKILADPSLVVADGD